MILRTKKTCSKQLETETKPFFLFDPLFLSFLFSLPFFGEPWG